MDVPWPRTNSVTSEEEMVREEARIEWLAWANRITSACLAAVAVAALLLLHPHHIWLFVSLPLAIGLPLAVALAGAHYVRLRHAYLLRRYQAHLLVRTMELQEMASRDELTGLHNRRYFYEFIETELYKARAAKEPLALVMMDLDGLKAINDEYGHMAGDAIIANLAKVILKHIRGTDIAARLGGDEFGVVMPGTDKRGAFALARRLWEELERTPMYEAEGKRVIVTVSVGVAGFPWGGEHVDEIMHWADADMYANKVSRRLPPQPVPAEGRRDLESLPDEYVAGI